MRVFVLMYCCTAFYSEIKFILKSELNVNRWLPNNKMGVNWL